MLGKHQKLSLLNRLLYLINSICAALLLLSYFLSFVSPKSVPIFSVLSLAVPILFIINIIFVVYWCILLKKQAFLSGFALVIGWLFFSPLFKLSPKTNKTTSGITVMSYNVRMFNLYKHIKNNSVDDKIVDFISEQHPDILAIQEYYHSEQRQLNYKYSYFQPSLNSNFGLAIFSTFPIINKGSLSFKHSANNAIFADIVTPKDTVRVYNLHLESLKINPDKENFGQENSEKLIKRLKSAFLKQASQVEQFLKHQNTWKKHSIVCGDFNNTAYSWVYRQISKHKKDAFVVAGSGTGKTFNYPFPARIDFILTDNTTTIHRFKTFDKKYSDHFPILSEISYP